jgi:primary-amine oxidase
MKPQPVGPRPRRRVPLPSLAVAVASFVVLATAPSLRAQSATHPLDPLSWDEHWTVIEALKAAGHVDDATRFSLVTLAAPDKDAVLAWQPGAPIQRAAFAIVKQGARTFEAEVDLAGGRVTGWEEVEGVQPNWLEEEFYEAGPIVMENPEWQAAMRERGYTDFSSIDCIGLPPGYFGTPMQKGRRVAMVQCTDMTRARTQPYTRTIAGLTAFVDLNTGEVIHVADDGVVPIPAAEARYDADGVGPAREKATPISMEQPQGPSFELDGHQVRWGNWSFHHRVDPRVGLVIARVLYKDGARHRSVLYEGSLSEIFVPYMDPSLPWYAFNFLDAGEFPAGGLAKPMAPGLDCPENAVFFDGIVAGDDGVPQMTPRTSCIFERYAGDVAWRHLDGFSETIESRPKRDLVVRMYAVLGNYDYNFDWIFQEDGTLQVRLAATGIAAVKAVRQQVSMASAGSNGSNGHSDDAAADAYGRFVDPNVVAVNHDHYFSFRLDLDVDGPRNSLELDALKMVELPEGHPRRSIWVIEPAVAQVESDAMRRINFERPVLWRVVNPREQNHVGYNTSYQLKPRSNALSLMTPDDYPQRRAGFIDHHLWATPYEPDERYAAGTYPTLSEPGMGLPAWTSADRSIADTDIVLWYTVGMHHVVRAEDWPVMPTAWQAFELRPFDFFDRNPALDLPKKP